MIAGRRFALAATAAAVVWYLCILVVWAFQPLTDSVPVGVDYTLNSPKAVSVSVDCNSLFDGASRGGSPLPTLKVQAVGDPPLAFQRTPCSVVHGQARIIFLLDTAVLVAIVSCFIWLTIRWRRAPTPVEMDPAFAG